MGALAVVAVSATTCWLVGLPTSRLFVSVALYLLLALMVARHLPPVRPGPGIGAANRVTLGRATLILPVVVLAGDAALALASGRVASWTLAGPGPWWVVALATTAMVLDGVDGRVARRTGSASGFGARFDMELDTLLLLALAGLVWGSGKAGAWVLMIGGLRYLFVLAGGLLPALRGELPARLRRKAVCVAQGVTLVVGVAPVTGASSAASLLAGALLLLGYSFAVDVAWLLRAGVVAQAPPLTLRG